jgi:hypothetical protein
MSPFSRSFIVALSVAMTTAQAAPAQQKPPHLAYVYPAGGQRGESFRVTVGGQYLDSAVRAYVSGGGVKAEAVDYARPPTQKEINELREKLQELRKKPKDPETTKQIAEIADKLATFSKLVSPALAERVTLQITVAADAESGGRELRLATGGGLSNPLVFEVGRLTEVRRPERRTGVEPKGNGRPRDRRQQHAVPPEPETNVTLPVAVNGQIMPGGVDRYRFTARKGERLVVAVSARELIPYLADAVPGWFQAAVAVYDSAGTELAYADHYLFHPDPVLCYKIPRNGQYVLEIRDSLYRGREDFVYRVVMGNLPFITSIFPLGARAGTQTAVEVKGWNLPLRELTVDAEETESGAIPLSVRKGKLISNRVSFAVDALPECLEQEPNDEPSEAQQVALPIIVNGRIDPPGDWDVYRFEGRAGQKIVAEVDARKLDSPLDSLLRLTDAGGRQLAANDDYPDKGAGLSTHHADSLLAATLPADGVYYLHLGDAQRKGGAEYGYRLRLGAPRPDFALRVAPSGLNVRAGGTVPLTVYALRRDGFTGEIALSLKDAPKGFKLSGGRVPAGQDQAKLTLTAPNAPQQEPINLRLEGRATIEGREVVRPGVPAEDMMQAFIYRHLVPMKGLYVAVAERRWPGVPVKFLGKGAVRLPAGGTAPVRFSLPRGPLRSQLRFVLRNPPEGISIEKATPTEEGVTLLLRTEARKVKPGQKGNLIVDVSAEKAASPGGGKKANKQRVPLGTLPAIPFEVVNESEQPHGP